MSGSEAVVVRRARPDDLAEVTQLELVSFPDDAWTSAYLAELLPGGEAMASLWVAELAGEIVGHAILSVVFEVAELQRIAAAPAVRRKGVARALLATLSTHAADAGAERLLLEVREHNAAAIALYRHWGFEELTRRPRYYRDGADAVVMAHPLDPAGDPGPAKG